MSFMDLKYSIVRRIATSIFLKWADGYKTPIFKVLKGISMAITGLILAGSGIDESGVVQVGPYLEVINLKWALLLNFLAEIGLDFAKTDREAKGKE